MTIQLLGLLVLVLFLLTGPHREDDIWIGLMGCLLMFAGSFM